MIYFSIHYSTITLSITLDLAIGYIPVKYSLLISILR